MAALIKKKSTSLHNGYVKRIVDTDIVMARGQTNQLCVIYGPRGLNSVSSGNLFQNLSLLHNALRNLRCIDSFPSSCTQYTGDQTNKQY